MSEFDFSDFSESMQDMGDDALRRMYAIQEGGLSVMHQCDKYVSENIKLHINAYRVEHDTVLYAEIVDHIDDELVREQEPADYLHEILAQLVLKLHESSYYRRRDRSTRVSMDRDMARSAVLSSWVLSGVERSEHTRLELFSSDMGSIGMTSLMLDYDQQALLWRLGFEGRLSRVTLMLEPMDPDDPDVQIVDDPNSSSD